MNIVEKARNSVNITRNNFDGELRDVVEAARLEMEASGVPRRITRDDDNPLVVQAIKAYVKADQAWEEPDIAQKQSEAFDKIVNKLAMTFDGRNTLKVDNDDGGGCCG